LTKISKKVRPVNSLIFISDKAGGNVPLWEENKQILATNSCVSVACYPEQDGPTEVILGTADEVDPGYQPSFDGLVATPSGVLSVQGVIHDTILAITVDSRATRVRIWPNHPRWADRIIVGIG